MIRRPPRSTLFPYRRSSDLEQDRHGDPFVGEDTRRLEDPGILPLGKDDPLRLLLLCPAREPPHDLARPPQAGVELGAVLIQDRKSTRLNSSHLVISYAVFCL